MAPLLAALLALVGSASARAEQGLQEPYIVFVAEDAAYARCGPDGEYYRTDPLRLGQELEVYLETEDGWLGIRPPENSFSWIPATSVRRIEGTDKAHVIDSEAVAWIGTNLGRARKYRWQIQLAEGEEVVIVGLADREGAKGPERWYRIVPPPGEFRWIHRSQTVDSAEALVKLSRQRQRDDDDHKSKQSVTATEPTAPDDAIADSGDDATVHGLVKVDDADDRAAASPSHGSLQNALQGIAQAFNVDARPVGSGVAQSAPAAAAAATSAATANPAGTANAVANVSLAAQANPAPDTPASEAQTVATLSEQVVLRDIASAARDTAGTAAVGMAADGSSWTQGVRPAAATSTVAPPTGSALATSTAGDRSATLTPTAPPALQEIPADDPAKVQALAARVAEADVAQLQLELSRQMAAGASASMVQPIRQRASQWEQQLTDPVQRDRAALLLERVEQYQRVAQRRSGGSAVLPAMATEPLQPAVAAVTAEASVPAAGSETAAATEDASPGFDRQGYLVQVYSARPDSPPFALTDASGRTLAYVSPSPGVNLRRYLNTQVGLYGQLNYHTGLETPHVIAERAVQIGR